MGSSNSSSSTDKKKRKLSGITGRMESIFLESDIKLGKFYSVHKHEFSRQTTPFELSPTEIKPEKKLCDVFHGDNMNIDLLLKILKIDDQMAINMFVHSLESSKGDSTKELLKFAQHTNNRTRILFYIRPCKQTILSQEQTKENTSGDQSFTHMVTEVIFGLVLLIRIEVPESLELRGVDKQLHSFRNYLRQNICDDGTQMPSQSIDDLKIISAWSNEGRSFSPKNISDVDKYINKWDSNQAKPLSFCLRPIETGGHGKIGYNNISFDTIHNILCQLIGLNTRLDKVREGSSGSEKMEQLDQLKELLEHFLHSLKKVVADARRRQEDQSALESVLYQDDYRLLIGKLDELEGQIQSPTTNLQALGASSQESSDDATPNILLLGETGVGKSTFINALVNYLKFDTFDEAQAEGPSLVIPAKFFITPTTRHKNEMIGLGASDPNEQHDKPGQSATQKCKTHDITTRSNIQLKIIDTPGFGDTRGRDVDKENIENIVSIIQNIKKLDAVCILLKPNVSRSDILFRSNLNMLFNLLPVETRKNVLFCFTNTRSTFYLPGDTAPLLIQLLRDLSGVKIPYEPSNTFCFDSESFRYLVAVKNKILFEDHQKLEYKESWSISVMESHRWLGAILSLKTLFASTLEPSEHNRNEDSSVAQRTAKSSKKSCSAANSSLNQCDKEEIFSA